MDFLKNNLFYVILLAVVLVVCIPSFILASAREKKASEASDSAGKTVRTIETQVNALKPVSAEAIARAKAYQAAWKEEIAKVRGMMAAADKHLDGDFLVEAGANGLPAAEAYRTAYYQAFDGLTARLAKAGLLEKSAKPIVGRAYLDEGPPTAYQIRVTQKQYWILDEIVSILTSPECTVIRVTDVRLDAMPNEAVSRSRPDNAKQPGQSNFWVYPLKIDFQVDFRTLPVLFSKFVNDEKICFIPDGYVIVRAFDETQPVYVPVVAVTLYCQVWDYMSTDFEKSLRDAYKAPPTTGRGAGARAGSAIGGQRRGMWLEMFTIVREVAHE